MKLQSLSNCASSVYSKKNLSVSSPSFKGGNIYYSEAAIRTALETANVDRLIISEVLASLRGNGSIKKLAEELNCIVALKYFQSSCDKPNSASIFFQVDNHPYLKKPLSCMSAIRIENGVIASDDKNKTLYIGQGKKINELVNAFNSHIETKLSTESYN